MVHNDVAVAEVSMALFEALMEHAHDLVSINSEHGVMRYVSPSVRRILGYDPHDLIGRSSFDLLHPEDAARVIRSYERVASQVQRQRPVRFRYRHADGHYLLLEASSTNLLAHPSVGGIVVNARDVTEEVAQERRLRFKAGALSRISDAVVVSDESLRVKYLNQAAERHYGVRAADVLGHPLEQLYSYRYLGSTTDDQVRAVLLEHGEWHGTVVLTTRDGRTLYAEASMAVTFGDGDSVELFSVMRDVTDRVRTEEQLRLLESVVVNATDAVIITDADPLDVPGPRIRYVNEAFTRLTGYRPQDVLGFTPRLLQGPQTDQAALRRIGVALRTGRHVREELVNYTAAGEPFWVDLSIVPVRGEDGIVTHFIAIQHDVTARRLAVQLEQDRRRVLELLLRGAALELVLEEIVRAVERQQPGARGSVMLLREGRLFHGAAPNLPPAYVASVEGIVAEAQVGSCGAAVTFGVPITTADVRTDPRWAAFVDIALANGLYACRSTPIFSGAGEVIGTFAVYYDAPLAEGVPDTGLPSLAAQLAALAVDHHRMSERLRYQATHDALTGLPNRFQLRERLEAALAEAHTGSGGALLFIDLDGFKQINDTLGHPVGDQLLIEVAHRFSAGLGPQDVLARAGGDEFLLILPGVADAEHAGTAAARLLETLAEPFMLGEREVYAASIGICLYTQDGDDVTTLLKHADTALYQAKEHGQNSFARFTPDLNAQALARLDLEYHLRRAIARRDLLLHYQPQFDIVSGELVGFEALVRWQHPTRGWLPPSEFIPIAEASTLIIGLGRLVLEEACRQNMAWQHLAGRPLRIAVNVSARQFVRDDFAEIVTAALDGCGLPPELLELEITESVMMHDIALVAQQLRRLRAIGVRIALDDFGTGYSSLAYLQQLALDRLKVDRVFVRTIGNVEGTGHAATFVQAVVTLAHSLGLDVLAEGVERRDQLVALREAGCDEAQGYLWSPPVSVEQAEALIKG